MKNNMDMKLDKLLIKKGNIMKIFFSQKKGLSGVIAAVILIALVMVTTAIIWTVVNNLITEKLEGAESCFDIFEKVTINNRYTCYNYSSNQLQFSINIGDIKIDEVLVAVSGKGTTTSFKLSNEVLNIPDLTNYPSGSIGVRLPGKNSGLTYFFDMSGSGFSEKPDLIKIIPIIGQKQCEASDSLSEIDNCLLLA